MQITGRITLYCLFLLPSLAGTNVFATSQGATEWSQLMARHQQLFRAGRYVEALPVIEQAVELAAQFRESDFRRTDSTGKLAMTLDYLGRFDEAAKLYNEILERIRANPGNELASTGLLRSIGRIHVFETSFQRCRGVLSRSPKNRRNDA